MGPVVRDVLRHHSAEGVGFEPTETGYASTVFKTVRGQQAIQEKPASDVAKHQHHLACPAH